MEELRGILRKYWGYEDFRPLQAEAMQSAAQGRDSVVVLPTGGGKSLCYQAPAVHLPGLAVVISPLISLMKDQVDALTDCGVPAACINSASSEAEKRQIADDIRDGRLKLLYLSPERLMTERTLQYLQGLKLSLIAIDEAHCISDWGHDFRPEYRMLAVLKEKFPNVGVHAYTATATEHVRNDIARELRLENPTMLVGSFDRPNLVYRVSRRTSFLAQLRDVLGRHPNESGIIYCIRRADVEETNAALNEMGYSSRPYHAGLSDDERKRNQEAFLKDRVKIMVATVAFGMGIDKSDVRFVVHAGAPKSLESYQQESGRAGRDGLEAECCLFYSGADFQTWRKLQRDLPARAYEIAMQILTGIEEFCTGATCRHAAIVRYFGQAAEAENCGACDVCLEEVDFVEEPLVLAQKILSCVVRLKETFGSDYTAQVLTGSKEKRILENGHERLSTWGLLAQEDKKHIRGWIDQLLGQGLLRKAGEYNVLQVTPEGWRVLRGEVTPRLLKPAKTARRESKAARVSWEGVDQGLFEELRGVRSRIAEERGMAPFQVFSDATLRDLARKRPASKESLLLVHGVGEKKVASYGDDFLQTIGDYSRDSKLPMDVGVGPGVERAPKPVETRDSIPVGTKAQAFRLFTEGKSIEEVQSATGRAPATVRGYLVEFIEREGITDVSIWVPPDMFSRIQTAADEVGLELLKPIHTALHGEVDYDPIQVTVACLRNIVASRAQ